MNKEKVVEYVVKIKDSDRETLSATLNEYDRDKYPEELFEAIRKVTGLAGPLGATGKESVGLRVSSGEISQGPGRQPLRLAFIFVGILTTLVASTLLYLLQAPGEVGLLRVFFFVLPASIIIIAIILWMILLTLLSVSKNIERKQ